MVCSVLVISLLPISSFLSSFDFDLVSLSQTSVQDSKSQKGHTLNYQLSVTDLQRLVSFHMNVLSPKVLRQKILSRTLISVPSYKRIVGLRYAFKYLVRFYYYRDGILLSATHTFACFKYRCIIQTFSVSPRYINKIFF